MLLVWSDAGACVPSWCPNLWFGSPSWVVVALCCSRLSVSVPPTWLDARHPFPPPLSPLLASLLGHYLAVPVAVRRGARRPHQPAFTTMCSSNTSSTRTPLPRTAATRTRPGLSSRRGGLGVVAKQTLAVGVWVGSARAERHGRGPLGPFFSPFFFFFFFFLSVVVWCSCSLLQRPQPLWHPSPWLAWCMPRRPPAAGVCARTRVAPRTGPVAWPLWRMFYPGRSRTVEQGPLPLVDVTMTAVWHTLFPSLGLPAGRRQRHRGAHGCARPLP